jgi:phthalate 4,5-dioxygenase oxygenase subunit
VVEFRKLMVDAARDMRDKGIAIGTTEPRIPHVKIRSFEGVVPKSTNWRGFTVTSESGQEKVA